MGKKGEKYIHVVYYFVFACDISPLINNCRSIIDVVVVLFCFFNMPHFHELCHERNPLLLAGNKCFVMLLLIT